MDNLIGSIEGSNPYFGRSKDGETQPTIYIEGSHEIDTYIQRSIYGDFNRKNTSIWMENRFKMGRNYPKKGHF